ncbi:universal stress protein [Nitratireductor basaltis]|uniref:UspA domain-containing protein n=1 Tax=Nitratireductor basaltis TaxID=472175 RepID=A0A084U6N5_9HYPH|nr:universal stress protein [Nitratireductor basaltis]KFB08621.1 UspA domain-containing protein [Nitratireductor basaltis]
MKIRAFVDGSIYSQSVCDHAAWAAGRLQAELQLMHVLGRREAASVPSDLSGALALGARTTLLQELSELDEQRSKLAQKRGRAILEDAAGMAHLGGADKVTTKLRHGDVLETLEALEAETDMFVIGKRGEAADFAKLHLGSNLERVVRAATRPVFVASRAFKPIQKVLVAFDGSVNSLKAVDAMSRSTLYAGLQIKLLMVGDRSAENEKRIEDARATLSGGSITAEAEIVEGHVEAVIAERVEQEGINLLVMGTHGHSRIRSLIIGSTTTEMLRSCKIPVMLYR